MPVKQIKIGKVNCNFERESLIRPFGFKGGYLSELWQCVVSLKSGSGNTGLGIGTQSVLWSDASVFSSHSEAGGNALMFAITEFALRRVKELVFSNPVELLEELVPQVHEYGKKITNNPDLRLTFTLNSLVGVDNAAWMLFARENNITNFDDMIPEEYRACLSYRHKKLASIPLMAYAIPLDEIVAAVKNGYFFLKVKIGSDPDKDGDREKMLQWDMKRIEEIHKAGREKTLSTPDRKERLAGARRIVLKLGTRMITSGPYSLDTEAMARLAVDIADLRKKGYEIVIVSSGAIAAGMGRMGILQRPRIIPQLQALASIGQNLLMNAFEKALTAFGLPIAQVLLTVDDIRKIVEEWTQDGFRMDRDGRINNPDLEQYIDFHAQRLIRAAPNMRDELLKYKIVHEYRHAETNEHVAHAAMFLDFVSACYNYIVQEYYDESDFHFCVMNLLHHILQTYSAFFTEMLSGLQTASLTHLRTMYETYVIARYIMKYKELSRPFRDHSIIVQYRIAAEFDKNGDLGELQTRYDELIREYGKDFANKYGWTSGRIEQRNKRKLSTLANDVGLGGYRSLYVLSSEMIHASSFSVVDESWTAKATAGFIASAVELLTNGLIQLLRAIDVTVKTKIILMNILYALREDLFDEPKGTGCTETYGSDRG